MDGTNWTATQAQGGGEGAGADAGDRDSGDLRTERLLYTRQRIVNNIMEEIKRHFPVFGQDGAQDLREIVVRFEEKMYNVATSWYDYLGKVSFKMLTMPNCLHPNIASSSQNAHAPERNLIRSEIEMDGTDWTAAQAQGGGAAARDMDSGDWWTERLLYTRQRIVNNVMEDIKRYFPVFGQDGAQDLREIVVRFEEKMYNTATSWYDYLWKVSFKMRTMPNCLHPNTTSSSQNAHAPEMTMEATSYETTSGPEDSDEEATEEDDGDVSKEDVVEEVVVRKEQNYVVGVGHKENVKVGETEVPEALMRFHKS